MDHQNPIGMKANEQVFCTPLHSRNRTIDRLSLQRLGIDPITQLRLPHSHAGNRSSDKPRL
jgi:hypothetical protein